MATELLAHNVAAHWVQAGALAGVAWLGVTVLRLRGSAFPLKYWQGVLLLLLLAPWIQPWQPVAATPARGLPPLADMAPGLGRVADVSVAGNIIVLPAERWSVDPWTGVLALLAAGVLVRLAWLGLGLVRLSRLARASHRVAPPDPAREFLAQFGMSATFVQRPDVRMPCSFGLFRPTVVLPDAFDRLEPAFQRAIVCHELQHLRRHDFVAALLEETATALLWFHPWVWLVRRRIHLHREQVVDAAVVRCTGDRRAYVRCLVALAGHPRGLRLAAPMLRSTELRARTDALFEKEGEMSKQRSAALAIGLCAALGAGVWTAAATVPLAAAAPEPVVQAPGGGQPAASAGPRRSSSPIRSGEAVVTVSATTVEPVAARSSQASGAGQPAAGIRPTIVLDFTLPGGRRPQIRGPEGELMRIWLRDAGRLGFVPRVRGGAQQVVTVTVFDLDTAPDRELGAVDIAVGGDPVTFRTSGGPFEIAVPRIVVYDPAEAAAREARYRAAANRAWLAVAEDILRTVEPERAVAQERTRAVLQELQQAVAAISDQLGTDETAGDLARQFAELQERFAELQERLAELQLLPGE